MLPPGTEVPRQLITDEFVLVPLGPEHNEADYRAWTGSIAHVRATPGFGPEHDWPNEELTLDDNRRDLEAHLADFDANRGFTFTVLAPGDAAGEGSPDPQGIIGCVYIYPDPSGQHTVELRCWVTKPNAPLDPVLRRAVADWLDSSWPFSSVRCEGL